MSIASLAQTYSYSDGSTVWIREATVAEFVTESNDIISRGGIAVTALEIEYL